MRGRPKTLPAWREAYRRICNDVAAAESAGYEFRQSEISCRDDIIHALIGAITELTL